MSEWGPMIEHDGKCRPVPFGTYLHVVAKCGEEQFGFMKNTAGNQYSYFEWHAVIAAFGSDDRCIVRYRIRRPKGLQILETILSEIPVKEVCHEG